MSISKFKIGNWTISQNSKTYFIADIAANHDGDLQRAKELIYIAAEAGADAAKFQHFKASTIVSDIGFKSLGTQKSHQSSWKKSVYETYDQASLNLNWTSELKGTCDKAGIAFFTSPYDFSLVDFVDKFVPAYKIGSGDITWIDIIKHIAGKQKPYILATGASTQAEVKRAVDACYPINKQLSLMQCNTNYTGSLENFKYINLNVLKNYQKFYPDIILGLSDHTPGHSTVLGAVALGAKIIEKHLTDDNFREGPDHPFSMNPKTWREMVDRTKELELALGNGIKTIEDNEKETVILQRRSIRAKRKLEIGHLINKDDIETLRPCPVDAISPSFIKEIIGKKVISTINSGEHLTWINIEQQ